MNLPTLAELKKELLFLDQKELVGLLTDLAKLNKDNKTFLYFKVFERDDPGLFVKEGIRELEAEFLKGYYSNSYHTAKKSAQRIRKVLNKLLALNKDKGVHTDLLIAFCNFLHQYGYLGFRHPVIDNLYAQQVRKLEKAISALHEDFQYDYQAELAKLKALVRNY
ncbi:hypothetical protein [Lunatimonas salinarum]|uniref:hypothetical protein n=1 Tax=Lunatimonas salinarum TaxID=1774590 RepID=UPI001AE00A0D|nr:hypothetical protein [Lunatimonas salinarum]